MRDLFAVGNILVCILIIFIHQINGRHKYKYILVTLIFLHYREVNEVAIKQCPR